MAADLKCVIRSIRTSLKDVDFENRIFFKDEVQNALHLLVEKHRLGTVSIQEVLCSQIAARDIMLEEIQHWIATIKRRLTPRMKAHNAWQIDFKRDIPIQVFSICERNSWF